jgi:nitrogen fixation NifU-like protein
MAQVPDVPLPGLYGELILRHYRNPHHTEPLAGPDLESEEFNPFCGDRVSIQLALDSDGKVSGVNTRSEGCSIIQASASMMSDVLGGKSLDQLHELAEVFRNMMLEKEPRDYQQPEMRELLALQVVREYPVRIKCALLPWTALEEGIEGYQKSGRNPLIG